MKSGAKPTESTFWLHLFEKKVDSLSRKIVNIYKNAKNVIPESVFIFDFWTKKMSKNEKGRLTFGKRFFCYHKKF
jgi:hypothetical protein